jgi:hypothetical protein
MALYTVRPVHASTKTSAAGSAGKQTLQRWLIYENTSTLVVQNFHATDYIYLYYEPKGISNYANVPATFAYTNSIMVLPSTSLSIPIGTASARVGGGGGSPQLYFAADNVGQTVQLIQILANTV